MKQRVYKNSLEKSPNNYKPQYTTKTNSEEREFDFQSYYFITFKTPSFQQYITKHAKKQKYDPCIRVNFSYKENLVGPRSLLDKEVK